jgi:hypothetical protein
MEIYLGKLVVKWVYSQYSQQFASWFEHGWTTSAGRPYLVETTNQGELQYPVHQCVHPRCWNEMNMNEAKIDSEGTCGLLLGKCFLLGWCILVLTYNVLRRSWHMKWWFYLAFSYPSHHFILFRINDTVANPTIPFPLLQYTSTSIFFNTSPNIFLG